MRHLGSLLIAFALVAACKAGEGESCFEENDCNGSLLCCKASFDPNARGTCAMSCEARDAGPGFDAGPGDAAVDAGPGDAAPEDAGFDAAVDTGPGDAAPGDGGFDAAPGDGGFDAAPGDGGFDAAFDAAPDDAGFDAT